MKPAAVSHLSEDSLADELALMRSVANGSYGAFKVVVDRFQQRIGLLAQRFLGNDADDVTQDVLVIVLEKPDDFVANALYGPG